MRARGLLLIVFLFAVENSAGAKRSAGGETAPWPAYCVQQFGMPPVSFGGPAGEDREFEQWRATLSGACEANWERGLAETRARHERMPPYRPSRCETLRTDVLAAQSDLKIAADSVRQQNSICRWWTLPYECPPVLRQIAQVARAKLARAQGALRAAGCGQK